MFITIYRNRGCIIHNSCPPGRSPGHFLMFFVKTRKNPVESHGGTVNVIPVFSVCILLENICNNV